MSTCAVLFSCQYSIVTLTTSQKLCKNKSSSLFGCTGQVTAFCFNRVTIVGKQQDPSRNCHKEAFLKIT